MFVIWKSMNKQLKRVDFDENDTENPRYTRKKAERAAKRAAAEAAPPDDTPAALTPSRPGRLGRAVARQRRAEPCDPRTT